MFGSEFVYVTPKTWHRLRSATAEAVNLGKGGASPFLAVGTMNPTFDPQLKGVLRRIRMDSLLEKVCARLP